MNFSRVGVLSLILAAASGVLLHATTVLDFIPLAIDGKPAPLASYRGKVLLIVNVASHSIFTPQYEGLEALYDFFRNESLLFMETPAHVIHGMGPQLVVCLSVEGIERLGLRGQRAEPS